MEHGVLDPRLRAARDRGLELLLGRLLPSGSLGVGGEDPFAYHHVPLAFAATGHLAAARRVLDYAAGAFFAEDGQWHPPREGHVETTERSAQVLAGFAVGALRGGRATIARKFQRWIEGYRAPASASSIAAVGRGALTHGPVMGAGADGVTDLAATVAVGSLDLALGRVDETREAARWVVTLWSSQPHPDAFLLRRDAAGALVTLWSANASGRHAIHALGPGSGHSLLGETVAWLVEVAQWSPADEAEAVGRVAAEVMAFATRCAPHITHAADAALVARGASAYARSLRAKGTSGWSRALDLAVELGVRAARMQHADGMFTLPSETVALAECVDECARVTWALQELLADADAVEPTEAPRASRAQGYRVVLCNVPEAHAEKIADALVNERLAACVNIVGPVRSVYEWKGKAERDTEFTLLIKTTAERMPALTTRVRALHPYEVPEVVALPLAADEGYGPYLDWVRAQVTR